MIQSRKIVVVISTVLALSTAPRAEAGTPDRIAKFITTTGVGNSALSEKSGRIGLGTTAPVSSFDIRSQNALSLWATRPYLTFRDSATTNSLSRIQGSNGGITFSGQSAINASNPSALVRIDKEGRLGIGTPDPQRSIQIGPSTDAMFTIEPSNVSPNAGFIRFGDNTGWRLMIGRSRESSGGSLNTGFAGPLLELYDNGAFRLAHYPYGFTGIEPLCTTEFNYVSPCESSSLRYKKDIKPYLGGLDVVERLHPISFTRIYNGRSDLGLAAEDVARIEPRFTYPNKEGQVEGIKYELLTAVLINAVKQQQKEIEELKAAVARLEASQQ
jgi:hypothetical protein